MVAADMIFEQNLRPDNPTGHIFGYNKRTRENGFFPGMNYVTLLKLNSITILFFSV